MARHVVRNVEMAHGRGLDRSGRNEAIAGSRHFIALKAMQNAIRKIGFPVSVFVFGSQVKGRSRSKADLDGSVLCAFDPIEDPELGAALNYLITATYNKEALALTGDPGAVAPVNLTLFDALRVNEAADRLLVETEVACQVWADNPDEQFSIQQEAGDVLSPIGKPTLVLPAFPISDQFHLKYSALFPAFMFALSNDPSEYDAVRDKTVETFAQDPNGELAWLLFMYSLQGFEEHRRQGYSGLIEKSLSSVAQPRGIEVVEQNPYDRDAIMAQLYSEWFRKIKKRRPTASEMPEGLENHARRKIKRWRASDPLPWSR